MTEVPLTGGHITPEVVRVGETVHRTSGPGAGFAVRLLSCLETAGYPGAPRFRGIDQRGRDVLTFIPGEITDHPSQRAAGACAAGGRMLRGLHDATAGHDLAGDRECVLHGDPGPFNTIFRAGRQRSPRPSGPTFAIRDIQLIGAAMPSGRWPGRQRTANWSSRTRDSFSRLSSSWPGADEAGLRGRSGRTAVRCRRRFGTPVLTHGF